MSLNTSLSRYIEGGKETRAFQRKNDLRRIISDRTAFTAGSHGRLLWARGILVILLLFATGLIINSSMILHRVDDPSLAAFTPENPCSFVDYSLPYNRKFDESLLSKDSSRSVLNMTACLGTKVLTTNKCAELTRLVLISTPWRPNSTEYQKIQNRGINCSIFSEAQKSMNAKREICSSLPDLPSALHMSSCTSDLFWSKYRHLDCRYSQDGRIISRKCKNIAQTWLDEYINRLVDMGVDRERAISLSPNLGAIAIMINRNGYSNDEIRGETERLSRQSFGPLIEERLSVHRARIGGVIFFGLSIFAAFIERRLSYVYKRQRNAYDTALSEIHDTRKRLMSVETHAKAINDKINKAEGFVSVDIVKSFSNRTEGTRHDSSAGKFYDTSIKTSEYWVYIRRYIASMSKSDRESVRILKLLDCLGDEAISTAIIQPLTGIIWGDGKGEAINGYVKSQSSSKSQQLLTGSSSHSFNLQNQAPHQAANALFSEWGMNTDLARGQIVAIVDAIHQDGSYDQNPVFQEIYSRLRAGTEWAGDSEW